MQKQQGFTLIELVVVIIILGILAVVAAPKFLNLQSDARGSTLEGVKASIQSANSMLYSKAAIAGKETADSYSVTIDSANTAVGLVYGYVKGDKDELAKVLDLDTSDWTITAPADATISAANVLVYPKDRTPTAQSKCFVEYTQATMADGKITKPSIVVEKTGC